MCFGGSWPFYTRCYVDCHLSRTFGADSGDDRSKKVEDVMQSQKLRDVAVDMKWNKSKSAPENELDQY